MDLGRSQGIGSLQRVPALYALVARFTAADRNVEAPDPCAAHNLFLVLQFHPLHRQRSAAFRALVGSVYLDLFVYVIGDETLIVAAMRRPGLAARPSRPALGLLPEKERKRMIRTFLRWRAAAAWLRGC